MSKLRRAVKALVGPTLPYRVRYAIRPLIRDLEARGRRPGDALSFVCNVCGRAASASREMIESDDRSCLSCGSSTRSRGMVHALSLALFGDSRVLPEFAVDRHVRGVGMTDWVGYAYRLAEKFDYMNTFFHQSPKLDITGDCRGFASSFDFVLSSDVLEHVCPPVGRALANVLEVLKPGGALVVSVPATDEGPTREHYPDLHEYEIVSFKGAPTLINRTKDGRLQVFENLVFHGGAGSVLELRFFSRDGLIEELRAAGFVDVLLVEDYARFGVIESNPPQGALVIARRAATSRPR